MGKIIGEIAESRGHHIAAKINIDNRHELEGLDPDHIDVAIEFSQPDAAFDNINWAISRGIPVVAGTTGWLDKKPQVESMTKEKNTAFFYASNFSVGVNIFFKVNRFLASLIKEQDAYQVSLEEIHHTEKKDAPSGTAITLAEGILQEIPQLKGWKLSE
jgi:4-hydroxy-tetrahydrodipicolinate reductase